MGVSRVKKRRAASAGAKERKVTAISVPIDDIYGGLIGRRGQEQDASVNLLAASIARHGLLQPVVVRRNARAGRYALICGARRLLACRLLGMKEIDALLVEADEQEAAACFMEEHLCREAPGFMDEAEAIVHAGEEGVRARSVLPPALLERRTRMLTLGEAVRAEVIHGGLTLEQAEPLLCVPAPERQMEAASIIAQRALTGPQARRLVLGEPMQRTAVGAGRRRALRMALEEVTRTAERLRRQGLDVGVAVHSQERGMCIQILLKNPENPDGRQEKESCVENKNEVGQSSAT